MGDWTVAQGMGALLGALGSRRNYYHYTASPDVPLCYPHYSDPTFDGDGAITFGVREGVAEWVEGETLPRVDEATRAVLDGIYGQRDTARQREARLRLALKDPTVRLLCIVARTDPQDGYTRTRYGIVRGEG